MRRHLRIVSLFAVAPLVACLTLVESAHTRTEPQARPARPAGYPIELVKQEVPERPFKVIGSVRAKFKVSESYLGIAPPSQVIAALKDEARALGGDALLPITVTPTAGDGNPVEIGPTEIWSALVIVWLRP